MVSTNHDSHETTGLLGQAKEFGFSDRQLAHIWELDESVVRSLRLDAGIQPVYKTVDTCAAEFAAYARPTIILRPIVKTKRLAPTKEDCHPRRGTKPYRTGD